VGKAHLERISGQIRDYLRRWVGDDLFRRLLKNTSQLLGGSIAKSALGFGAVLLAARGLGPEKYGILVLIQAYVTIIDKLVNFQSWQALIKYGADALEKDDPTSFKRLIKFGTFLDAGSAVLGTLVTIAVGWILGVWGVQSMQFTWLMMGYSGVVLSNLIGTPKAILRLFDRFDVAAIQQIVAGVLRLGGVVGAFIMDAPLWGYLLAWLVGEVAGHLLLLGLGWRELRVRGYLGIFSASVQGITKTYSGLWNFVWTTNLNGSVRMTSRRMDTVIIGGVLGPAAVGLYEIAKKFATILNRLSNPLYQAIYPELAKLWSAQDREAFVRLIFQLGAMAGAGALLVWIGALVFGTSLLNWTVGAEYVGAYSVLVWYMLAVAVEVAAFPLQPAMLAMGHPRKTFVVHVVTTVLYFGALGGLLYIYELPGAGMAYLVYYLAWTSIMAGLEYMILSSGSEKVENSEVESATGTP
jgi:O-antigen/teichoic acid export membrane protein